MQAEAIEGAVWFSLACSLAFVIGYTIIAPWWRTDVGRAMVSLDIALLAILAPSVIHYVFGLNLSHPFFGWYYFASLVFAGAVTLQRLMTIVKINRESSPIE